MWGLAASVRNRKLRKRRVLMLGHLIVVKEPSSPTAGPANLDAQAACPYSQVGTFASSGHTGLLDRLVAQRWDPGAPGLHMCDSYTSCCEKGSSPPTRGSPDGAVTQARRLWRRERTERSETCLTKAFGP